MPHTPGPWHWDGYELLRAPSESVTDIVLDISVEGACPSVDDARLIAAAPELLAALKALVMADDAAEDTSSLGDALAAAEDAIAKAEGREP